MTDTPRLELIGISKAYPGVVANNNVDLKVMPGEIHALLGENGAGKSTLVKFIYGVQKADSGTLLWEGDSRVDQVLRPTGEILDRRLFGVDSGLMVERREDFAERDGPRIRVLAQPVGRPNDLPVPHPTASQQGARNARPVVAAALIIDLGRPAELAPHDHADVLVQASIVQILNESASPENGVSGRGLSSGERPRR